MFNHSMLDLVELGLTDVDFMDEFTSTGAGSAAMGNRPLLLFNGQVHCNLTSAYAGRNGKSTNGW